MQEIYQAGEYKVVLYHYLNLVWRANIYYFGSAKLYKRTQGSKNKGMAIREVEGVIFVPRNEWKRLPGVKGNGNE